MKIFKQNLNIKNKKGVALLFAILVSGILFAVAAGVIDISFNEAKFATSAKATNEAFLAADTGAEVALYNDKSSINLFTSTNLGPTFNGVTLTMTGLGTIAEPWKFNVGSLGNSFASCAIVTVSKTSGFDSNNNPITTTQIISKGYDKSNSSCVPNQNSVERQLEVSYTMPS